MKKLFSIFAALLSVAYMASCQSVNNGGGVQETISVSDFESKLARTPDAQLVDVRTPGEYEAGHLKNSQNIDFLNDDSKPAYAKLDKDKPVFVYCKSGGRSGRAASMLHDMGFKTVYNMDGGMMKWDAAGKPMETGSAAPAAKGMSVDEFNKLVSHDNYVLVDYNAQWCEPCKKMLPIMEKLAVQKKDKMILVKVDADQNKELLKTKHIEGIPYLELYNSGKLVWSHQGYIEEADLLKETKL